MSATKIGLIAAGAATTIEDAAITSQGNDLKVYAYEPRDLDSLPAVTIDGPVSFRRVDPDDAESQLGSNDWHLTYTLRVYVAFDDPETATAAVRAVLGQVIAAIDADRSLDGSAEIDAVLSSGELGMTEDENQRQMAVATCDLDVWALV